MQVLGGNYNLLVTFKCDNIHFEVIGSIAYRNLGGNKYMIHVNMIQYKKIKVKNNSKRIRNK
jgi:hypothetical protein